MGNKEWWEEKCLTIYSPDLDTSFDYVRQILIGFVKFNVTNFLLKIFN